MAKKFILCSTVIFLFCLGFIAPSGADTILFPVIAVNQPNVTTIVSVFNGDTTITYLKYIYRYKDSLVGSSANITGGCTTAEFVRNTKVNDLVSFDVSGTLNSGNALFNDSDSYGGAFTLPGSGPRRAYLLVTHSNASGTRLDSSGIIGGEAIIMDIATGAAWGYKAINDSDVQDYTFVNYNDRVSGNGVFSSISDSMWIFSARFFTFFPPNEWSTKFFVTPIGGSMTSDRTAEVGMASTIWDRNATELTGTTVTNEVKCTAALGMQDMMDSTLYSAIENIGGWSFFFPTAGDVIVYKLEYVVNNPTYGGTNNNAYLLSTYEFL